MVDSSQTSVGYHDIVIDSTDQAKYICYSSYLHIYSPKYYQKSLLIIRKNKMAIDKTGFFEGYGLLLADPLAEERIADLLPCEYEEPGKPDGTPKRKK
jgi:hypothetical protein